MFSSVLLLYAAAALGSPSSAECQKSVGQLLASAPASDARVVITFTGTQEALLPIDEQVGPAGESTLFPVGANAFVLTIQIRSDRSGAVIASGFANRICALGVRPGARFNGVLTFVRETKVVGTRTLTRERMTDAAMAKIPEN